MKSSVVEKIRAAGGEVYAITSEPQYLADQAHEHWELDFENVGDPHQEISRTCSERGWLTLYANKGDLDFLQRGADWKVEPRWNLCNAPGGDSGKVDAVGRFLDSDDQVLVCTHATFRFAVDKFGIEAFDNRLIAVDEFHHGMDDALSMDDHIDLGPRDMKEPSGFDHFQALVKQGRGVDGDLGAHVPGGMFQRLFESDIG